MPNTSTCPYVLLGVEHGASPDEARRAHRALMLAGGHEDKGADRNRCAELGGALLLIKEGKASRRCDCGSSRGASDPNRSGRAWNETSDDFWETVRRAAANARPSEPRSRRQQAEPTRRPSRPAGWEEVPEHPETVDEWSARCKRNADRYARAPGHRGAAGFNEGPWPHDPPPRPDEPGGFDPRRDPFRGAPRWTPPNEKTRQRAEASRDFFRERARHQAEENARNEEKAAAEREAERQAARARQDAQNARPTSTPNFFRAGRPIYEPGADRPSEATRKLFRK